MNDKQQVVSLECHRPLLPRCEACPSPKISITRAPSVVKRNWTRLLHLLDRVEPPGGEVANHMRNVVWIGLANLLHLRPGELSVDIVRRRVAEAGRIDRVINDGPGRVVFGGLNLRDDRAVW